MIRWCSIIPETQLEAEGFQFVELFSLAPDHILLPKTTTTGD